MYIHENLPTAVDPRTAILLAFAWLVEDIVMGAGMCIKSVFKETLQENQKKSECEAKEKRNRNKKFHCRDITAPSHPLNVTRLNHAKGKICSSKRSQRCSFFSSESMTFLSPLMKQGHW
jgi:hypothetical protein